MIKKLTICLVALAFLIGGVFWFSEQKEKTTTLKKDDGKLQVVVTNSILADLVKNVGQEKTDVYSIVKPGVDPHEYEPKPQDIAKVVGADVIFYNGLKLETGGNGWFKKMVQASHKRFGQDVFAASTQAKVRYLHADQPDPHAWLSLANGKRYVAYISEILAKKDPVNAKFYRQNAQKYQAKLTDLDAYAKEAFAQIAPQQRLLVTSEGAMEYFAQAYGLQTAYIWALNTEAQGTPEQLKIVLAKIKQNKPASLFVESSVSPKAMQKVSNETGVKIYAKIYTDSLGAKGSKADTYYKMMQTNITRISQGLTKPN